MILLFIIVVVFFGVFLTALISASRYEYSWHQYCVSCEKTVLGVPEFCGHCGETKEDWKGTRKRLKTIKGVKSYEYKP